MSAQAHDKALLDATCRVAFAGLMHDLGKFAERADAQDHIDRLEEQKQEVCPKHLYKDSGKFSNWSHFHAAYTGLQLDALEGFLPPLTDRKGDNVAPFWPNGGQDRTDSLASAAARHHAPETFLQWVVATADRVASGFERDEDWHAYNEAGEPMGKRGRFTARLYPPFSHVFPEKNAGRDSYALPLQALSPDALLPCDLADMVGENAKAAGIKEYADLWDKFKRAVWAIAGLNHKDNWPLWLDHFDSAWLCFAQAIPSATVFVNKTRPDVSLYDHSKAVAAFAAAIWRYHHDRKDDEHAAAKAMANRDGWKEPKILLVQGDFFGIQDFVFASGKGTTKRAAKLLRGRSFQVSLLCELAALKVLDALALPPTSQIVNAAGKFLIVAPNTEDTKAKLAAVRRELDQWFLQHTYGRQAIGLASVEAKLDEFKTSQFKALLGRLADQLDEAKLQRFDLCGDHAPPAIFSGYLDAVANGANGEPCTFTGELPADGGDDDGDPISRLAKDQIRLGAHLVKGRQLWVGRDFADRTLALDYFGYRVRLPDEHERKAPPATLIRGWDFGQPSDSGDESIFAGCARRWVNGYVPNDDGAVKDFASIAAESPGLAALGVLKGDVDNLGNIFHSGMAEPTFAKWAGLSRQLHMYFAVRLPWLCAQDFPETYTVFAGGDDFFLIGPWQQTLRLAEKMRADFGQCVRNAGITFSAGFALAKEHTPVPQMAQGAEHALEAAKRRDGKDCVTAFGRTVTWGELRQLLAAADGMDALRPSTGYLYSVLALGDAAERQKTGSKDPEDAMWRARFGYRTARVFRDNGKLGAAMQQFGDDGLSKFKGDFRVALSAYLYSVRAR